MSLVRAQAGIEMGRCERCDHDLVVISKRDLGKVWCSNRTCRYNREPYPNRKNVNAGRAAA